MISRNGANASPCGAPATRIIVLNPQYEMFDALFCSN